MSTSFLPPAGEDFASAATRLSGLAAAMWGWAPAVFWDATPAEVAAVAAALMGDQPRPLDGAAVAALREAYPDG